MAKIALGMTVGFMCGMHCARMNGRSAMRQLKKKLIKRLKV